MKKRKIKEGEEENRKKKGSIQSETIYLYPPHIFYPYNPPPPPPHPPIHPPHLPDTYQNISTRPNPLVFIALSRVKENRINKKEEREGGGRGGD